MKNLEINQELQTLRINFAKGIDESNWELFAQTLNDEVLVDYIDFGIPAKKMTREQIVELIRGTLKKGVKTQHFVSNFNYFDITEKTINGIVYVLAKHFMPSADGASGESFDVNARYIDSYVLTDDGWKISKFKLSISWFTGNPTSAFNL
ncbi:MAG: nuclear transport factor 2 family protein [Lactococcus garvieae]